VRGNRLFKHRDLGNGVLEEHGRIENLAPVFSLGKDHIFEFGTPIAGRVSIIFEMAVLREIDKNGFYIEISVV
jgi:hypothetical protein